MVGVIVAGVSIAGAAIVVVQFCIVGLSKNAGKQIKKNHFG